MIRHFLVAALRNMAANRLLSAIAIFGLTLGFTGAILMALVIRSQLTFDNFIPGHERVYLGITDGSQPGAPPWIIDRTHREFARLLTLNLPELEGATRLMLTDQIVGNGAVVFRRGHVSAGETIYWADPNAFDVLPLPVLHGDLRSALRRPDGVVLPRSVARKYFGRENVVGEGIQLNGHPMTVRAVIEDLPANHTQLETGIFASNLASFLGFYDYKFRPGAGFTPVDIGVRTYFRLRPGADIAAFRAKAAPLVYSIYGKMGVMRLARLDRVHLVEDLNAAVIASPNAGVMAFLRVAGIAGLLVLFLAGVNFVNLTLARAARREREIGTRKVCGAGRPSLIAQFLGEALIAAGLAGVMALGLAEWLLPAVNAFLGTGASFDYRHDPLLIPALLLAVAVAGIAAGAWPAFVLSGFRPAHVLKGWSSLPEVGLVRGGLVAMQFAILIVLAIAAGVVWQQWHYAARDALRAQTGQMLIVRLPGRNVSCANAFADEVRRLAGVEGVACTGLEFLDAPVSWRYPVGQGQSPNWDLARIDTGIFALYGIAPLAGRLDPLPADYDAPQVVINQTAVRMLGFASPAAAIGQSLPYLPGTGRRGATRINAVVPDFRLYPVTHQAAPGVFIGFVPGGAVGSLVHVKLRGGLIPETLAAIDRLWDASGREGAIDRFFLEDHMQQRYLAMLRQAQMIAVCAGLAVLLACLGLVGIAISTAERRTKEIGIRKAMGATTPTLVALLLWQFSRPVLWANLIALPMAWWLMRRWLSGFADRVDLDWWLFAGASLGVLLVALLAVAAQALLAARRAPVLSLRYE